MREQFFSQLRFFADTHGFTIRIAPATPDDEYFGVVIHRSDILVTCDSVWNPEEFEISFYQEGNHPVASGSVDKLVGDRNKLSNRCRALQFRKRIELSAGRRTWQAADGSWHVTTHGVGNNVVPGMSEIDQWSGPDIFNELDRQMRENIERHHGSARASW
ncbi:MAG: hypothetical protein EOR74_34920 [Mesorhizobium sp.]|nr:MAG: hypothetical protein EOR74_34920 [Mesorhizobium sp.]RWM33769.1 MAG: hypothetical protein EOR75_27340 [Mesorhizobium sp.]